MSNIHSILPLINDESWRWEKPEINRVTVAPGNSAELFSDPSYPGFVYFGLLAVNGADGEKAEIQFDFDQFETNRSYEELFRVGLTGNNGINPSITRYDTDDDIYAASISPNIPIAYTDAASIEVRSPNTNDVVVDGLGLNLQILDVDLFTTGYQRATSGMAIDQFKSIADKLDSLNSNMTTLIDQVSSLSGTTDIGDDIADDTDDGDLDWIENLT